jgi:hypothetical protein
MPGGTLLIADALSGGLFALELTKDRCLFRMPGGTLSIADALSGDEDAIADIILDR